MVKNLTKKEQHDLICMARKAVTDFVTAGTTSVTSSAAAALNTLSGCFVTIRVNGEIRGSMGNCSAEKPLYQMVQEMAVSAAAKDPRYYPLKTADLADYTLEISVLSPLQKVESPDGTQVGVNGLYIVKGNNSGILLPQVALDFGWNLDQMLQRLCIKACMPEDAWQGECELYSFTAQVFKG